MFYSILIWIIVALVCWRNIVPRTFVASEWTIKISVANLYSTTDSFAITMATVATFQKISACVDAAATTQTVIGSHIYASRGSLEGHCCRHCCGKWGCSKVGTVFVRK